MQIVKNVGSSWFGLAVNILVGIFLSPLILHKLGDAAFGIWVLIFSVTGYYGLFDLGIRSSIVRYVAKFSAVHDNESLARLVNTVLFSYTVIGLVTMAVTWVMSLWVDSIFRIPPDFLQTARILFLMVGGSVAIGFPLGVFAGVLEGLQRFYLLNLTNVVSTLLRAVLIIYVLRHGYGLLTVAAITIALPVLTALARAAFVLSILPLKFGWGLVDRKSMSVVANYSSASFVIMLAYKLRFRTDELVLGAFLSSTAITYFSIADRLVDYAGEVVSGLAQIFVPMSSQSEARGDMVRLRKIFVAGNRACALIIFPLAVFLIVLGKSVITVWIGAKYVAVSYPVLLVILLPSTLLIAQGASPRILFGMGKHKALAWIVSLEALANLALSIILVRYYGIMGDAVGTAIPLLFTTTIFLPTYLCRSLQVRKRTFVLRAYLLPFLLCLPMAAGLLLMQQWFVAQHYWQLGVQILVGGLIYGAGLLWAYRTGHLLDVSGLTPIAESATSGNLEVAPGDGEAKEAVAPDLS